jgi:hypothetical protein
MIKKFLPFIIVLVLVIWAVDVDAQGCSMCKARAENAAEEMDESMGQQLNYGILYLMSIPYIILFLLFRKKIFKFFKELKSAGR